MTWRKTGEEFDNECAHIDLTNGAYRTHQEGIGYLYSVGAMNCLIPKRRLPKMLNSPTFSEDVRELVDHGFWADRGDAYEVMHHGDVVRASLAAQAKKRDRDKRAQRNFRERQKGDETSPDVSADVSDYVSGDADRQTDKHLGGRPQAVCEHGTPNGDKREPWSDVGALICPRCEEARRSA